MTSQRFLNDKVAFRDFLKSLKGSIAAPLVTFAVLCLFSVGEIAVFAKSIKKKAELMTLLKNHELISYFGGTTDPTEYSDSFPMWIIMILCGIVVALSLFSFAFKKNSVNVYFSVGLTRTRMFLNRIAAGVIELFTISLIPYLIVFFVNIGLFGFHAHQLKLFAYYSLVAFVSGLSGLAIGAFAASVSGSRIEAVVTAATSSAVFIIAAAVLSGLKNLFLLGYVGDAEVERKIMLFSPWFALFPREGLDQLVKGKNVPKELLLTWKGDFFPIALWAVASVVIFAVALLLFKKRKNENTASFGKYAISSAVNGAAVFLVSIYVLAESFSSLYSANKIKSVALCIILSTLISFVIFFIAELIIRRNIKAVIRMLPVYGGLALVTFAALLVIGTGYFGTYNKLPDIKDVEFISMDYVDPLNMLGYRAQVYNLGSTSYADSDSCKSSNPDDIKMCFEQFEKVKSDKRTDSGEIEYIRFLIKTKDGKYMARSFPIYSEEVSYNYSKTVFESDYFHSIIKMNLKNMEIDESYIQSAADGNGPEYIYDKYYSNNYFDYFGASLLADVASPEDEEYFGTVAGTTYEMTQDLKEALYEDLCKITYDEYYGRTGELLGALVTQSYSKPALETTPYYATGDWLQFNMGSDSETEKMPKITIADSGILLSSQMTKTLELLKSEEMEPVPHTVGVKAVICPDKKLEFSQALVNVGGDYYYERDSVFFKSSSASTVDYYDLFNNDALNLFNGKTQGTYLDFLEIIYGANDVKISRIDDKVKAAEIANAARTVYNTAGDNGRYIFVIYDDGSVVTEYLPEKSLSVLN